jgi:hypothetical protein
MVKGRASIVPPPAAPFHERVCFLARANGVPWHAWVGAPAQFSDTPRYTPLHAFFPPSAAGYTSSTPLLHSSTFSKLHF